MFDEPGSQAKTQLASQIKAGTVSQSKPGAASDSTNPLAGLDLRVGRIVEVNDHPNADKLYVMKIDLGDEQRQLVAGMKPYYPVDEISGKKMIMVCNLKPAKLRGVKSMGMLLAADDGDGAVVLLTPEDDVEPVMYALFSESSAIPNFPWSPPSSLLPPR